MARSIRANTAERDSNRRAASRPSISRSGRSITGWPIACAPTCFCACSPTTWSGTCASAWRPCSTTTPTRTPPKCNVPASSPKPSAPPPPSPSKPPAEPRTASQSTASGPFSKISPPSPETPSLLPSPPSNPSPSPHGRPPSNKRPATSSASPVPSRHPRQRIIIPLSQQLARSQRRKLRLEIACGVARNKFSHLKKVIGIAIDAPKDDPVNSEDLLLLDDEEWSDG